MVVGFGCAGFADAVFGGDGVSVQANAVEAHQFQRSLGSVAKAGI